MAEREDLSGRTLGEFVLRERIDEGGYGAVYRCEQPLLGREAVVKVLHKRLRRNDVVLQRFMREAQLASRLDHPYAAHVYAFGIEHDDGLFWIAMEMVQGTALNRWLADRGPLPLDQFVPFFERVAEVVQTAHERGIVHRDLKPSNVMVVERAGRLLPKLLDFGIAKLLDEAALPRSRASTPRFDLEDDEGPTALLQPPDGTRPPGQATTLSGTTEPPPPRDLAHRLTHADSTIGSPPYMSPEQWSNAVTVGPASDLYALGVVAYEALTGRRPFTATTLADYADLHCKAAVPALGDGFSPVLDRWFDRALAKRPEQRWASALELASALRVASGVGGDPAELPRLEDSVRDAWLADAPQPLAESVAALDGARNAYHARDAAHDLVRGLLRYLLALGLATRAQVRDGRDDPELLELLRAMRIRDLVAADRVRLLRLLVRPFAGRRGAHPIPELVDLVTPRPEDDTDGLDPLLALQPATEYAGGEDVVRAWLARLVPELTRALRRTAFVLDHVLVVPRPDAVERWAGSRRRPRALATVHAGELVKHHPMLLDRKGRVCVDLFPVVQAVSPTEGAAAELFVFDGRGRHGARMIAAPAGYEHHDPGLWEWIAGRLLTEAAGPGRGDDRPPYLGLAPYAVGDAARFVGRELEVDALLGRLHQRPLQVVVGPSGTGKSSLVHAGVIPRLPPAWRAITMRPGSAPLATLAARLVDAGVAGPDLAALLATAPATAAARAAEAAGGGTLVIVIDQLEELFTLCASRDERARFAAALAQLAASADLPIRVIATLRDDFLGQLEALPVLRALLSPALVQLGNPQRDDLVRIIVEPARRAGYALSDPELADDMVGPIADHPGALALVSFTALRLWELRDRRFHQLTRSAYDATGGMAGALVRHAEATLGRLATDEQRAARAIFRQLVTADGARARLAPSELRQRLAHPRAAAVLDKLVAARLIAMLDLEGEPHIEIIHDALLDAWPRLQRWIREDVDGARMRDQLRTAARQWNDRVRPRGLLWRDDALADLERWLRRGKAIVLSDLEAAFVAASRRLARRTARLRRSLVLIAAGVAIVFAVFQYHAQQAGLARRVTEAHLTQAYVEHGRDALLEGKSAEALIYLARARHRGDASPMVKFMLARAAQPLQGELARLDPGHGRTWWAMFSPDGRWIVTTDDQGARIWDAQSKRLVHSLPHGDTVYQAAFTPDGTRVLTVGADGSVKVWNVETGRLTLLLSRRRSGADVWYVALAVSPRGTEVAAIDITGGIADVWDLRTGEPIAALLDGQEAGSASLEFSHDGRWLALSATSGVAVYDTATWKRALTLAGPGVEALSFDPTGPQLATATAQGDVSLWTIPAGKRTHHLRETGDKINHVAFSPDGGFVAAAGKDGANRIWNARTGEFQAELKNHHDSALWVEFDSSSRRLVSSGSDGVVAISDVVLRTTVATFAGPRGPIRDVHFDPSSQRVIGASWNSGARVWDATRSYLQWANPSVSEDCGRSVRLEPDRRFIAIACANRGTRIWDTAGVASPRLLAELPSPTPVPGAFISPRPAVDLLGERAAIAEGPTVTVHELPGGTVVATVHHTAAVTTVAFAASGRDLITGSVDGVVRITRGGGEEFELVRLPAAVDTAGFLPDGRVVIADASRKLGVYDVVRRIRIAEFDLPARVTAFRASSNSGRLLTIPTTGGPRSPVLWDLGLYRQVAELDAHQGSVFSARFVSGDREILAAGTDGAARLWDAATGHLRKVYFRNAPHLLDAALDPTGTTVVTAGGDGVLRFWDRSSARMIWSLRVHEAPVAGVHFEGSDVVTQGFTGEIARWTLPPPPQDLITIDGIARCLPLRFDEETGGLVEQKQPCDH